MPGPVVSRRRAFMGMPRAAHVRPLPRGKPAVVGVLDAPRRGVKTPPYGEPVNDKL